jgi:myo-inositol-1-phosphate synthase
MDPRAVEVVEDLGREERGITVGGIRLAIAGVGNCASSLLQGIEYYRDRARDGTAGLLHADLGGYVVGDIRPVAAFDVDRRKVGRPLQEAVFAPPNCTTVFQETLPDYGVSVQMAPVLDGVPEHMAGYPDERAFRPADLPPCDVARVLRETGAEVLVCYMPVGSEQAVRNYADACLEAGVAMVNCMPVFIASDPAWAARFRDRGLPIVGDDIKSQLGATIVHRVLARLFSERGVKLERTYQLNTGGNTDFLNMLERHRLLSKRISKTESVQSQLDTPLPADQIHIGPSDYVPWQNDNKICFLRMEWRGFGGVPMNLELRLSVEDSPNSAGMAIDGIRCAKVALNRGIGGPLLEASAVMMKRPPRQMHDAEAHALLERWIAGGINGKASAAAEAMTVEPARIPPERLRVAEREPSPDRLAPVNLAPAGPAPTGFAPPVHAEGNGGDGAAALAPRITP